MKVKEFRIILQKSESLSDSQRRELAAKLNVEKTQDAPPAITDATPSCCPHCDHQGLQKWGNASGLQRWRCKDCRKTFNILTGTPLARLRKKEKWLDNAKAMIAGKTLTDTGKDCEVHRNTAFRWRHRFLELQKSAQHTNLQGIAESDATYFYRSEKGSKKNSIESVGKEVAMVSAPD